MILGTRSTILGTRIGFLEHLENNLLLAHLLYTISDIGAPRTRGMRRTCSQLFSIPVNTVCCDRVLKF